MATPMVAGIGLGLFLIAVVWGFSFLLCLMFSRATGPKSYVGFGAIIFALLFSVILLALPKEDFQQPQTKIYDWTIVYRSCLLAGCCLFLVIGMVAYFLLHVMEPVYAQRIKKLR